MDRAYIYKVIITVSAKTKTIVIGLMYHIVGLVFFILGGYRRIVLTHLGEVSLIGPVDSHNGSIHNRDPQTGFMK